MRLSVSKDLYFHFLYYLVLITILGLGIILFYLFAGNSQRQFTVIIATSITYFLWGVVYHKLEGDLHPKIVVEYLLIALLAILLLHGAIYQ